MLYYSARYYDTKGWPIYPRNWDMHFFVYMHDSKRLGRFALERLSKDHVHVWSVYIDESCQGQGHGQKMMQEAVDWAKKHGYKFITLGVYSNNYPAIKAYMKAGFVVMKKLKRKRSNFWHAGRQRYEHKYYRQELQMCVEA